MTQRQKALLSCAVAAALLLSGCRKGSSNSGSMSSSNAMSGSSGSASTTQTGGWKTGLGILTEASDEARTGTIHTIAAAVLLDGDGKLADVMLDELEVEVTAYRLPHQAPERGRLPAGSGIFAEKGLGRAGR